MKFVQVNCDHEHLNDALMTMYNSKLLHAEQAYNIIDDENEGKLIQYDNVYSEYCNSLKNICHRIGLDFDPKDANNSTYTNEEIESFMHELETRFALTDANEAVTLNEDDEIALEKLAECDFIKIHQCQYISIGLGRIPLESYKKIEMHNNKFIYVNLHTASHYHWIAYATSNTYVKETLKTLESLFFEPIVIPEINVKKVIAEYKDKIVDVYAYCEKQNTICKLYDYVAKFDENYVISGFLPVSKVEDYKAAFKHLPVKIDVKDVDNCGKCSVPTLLKNNAFFKPFELFVDMYSTPKYGDIDPTAFVAITYCILFGIMFGDLGQGLLLFLGGEILYKKTKNKLAGIVARVGITSMIFGFLFGSVFGLEELLNPIHQSLFGVRDKLFHTMDSSSTMTLLIGAVLIGAVLILVTMILNIYKNAKHKRWGEVLFSQNGVAGFIFYSYILAGLGMMFLSSTNIFNPVMIGIFIIVPILCFFFKEPLSHLIAGKEVKPASGWGNFVLETIFEVFEIALSFVTNTMSYLRVGGFVLSHAGMMLVVMTLVEMTGNGGPLVFILGNIFVMCLEGLIVGIQALRLEYYEMFSRYYDGNGKKYEVLTSVE